MLSQTSSFAGPRRAVTTRIGLGKYEIPILGYGTYRLDRGLAAQAVSYAIECGFRHIDCAKVYGNQREVGEGIADAVARNRVTREDLFVTGKLWPTDQHPERVKPALQETLTDLGVGYLDLFLVHWPVAWKHTGRWESDSDKYPKTPSGVAAVDETVSLLDTWRAMEELVDAGLVRQIGLCNSADEELKTLRQAKHAPVANQIESHPALQQQVLRATMAREGVLPICYCPLAAPTRFTEPDYAGICSSAYMQRLAEHTGFSPQRMVLNWAVDNYNAVLVKATSKDHIRENAKVSTGMLSDAQRRMIQAYESMHGRVRVINPTDFTATGKPFFAP